MLHLLLDIMQIVMCYIAVLNIVIDFFFNRIKRGRVLCMLLPCMDDLPDPRF